MLIKGAGYTTVALLALLQACHGLPRRLYERATTLSSLSSCSTQYDYIIIGGGCAGLTVADRLTEDPSNSVLVVEYGDILTDNKMPQKEDFLTQYYYNLTSVPQTGLGGRQFQSPIAAAVGGGSAVSAMFHQRGTAPDYDAWESLGNNGWGWSDLYPYFKKVDTFTPPHADVEEEFDITYDASAYGTNGPIQVTYPPYQYPGLKIMWDAWDALNVSAHKEGGDGYGVGRIWVPSSQDPVNQSRSDADTGHYERVKARPNYHLLVRHKATKINLSILLQASSVVIQSRDQGSSSTISAKKEIIVAAGAIHTPNILHRSGIGPKSVLQSAGITTKVNLPGVGYNLQDHPFFYMVYEFATNVWPNPEALTDNATFRAEAMAEYLANRTGPFSLGIGNTAAYLPLRNLTSNYQSIINSYTSQSASAYLASGTPSTVAQGYAAQKALLASLLGSKNAAVMEIPFSGKSTPVVAHLKPVSRGSVLIDSSLDPVIDYRTFTNPVDLTIMTTLLKYTRTYHNSQGMTQLGPVELVPGASVASDADIVSTLQNTLVNPAFYHPCGTTAMMPLNKGGVVGTDLKVYGVGKLSVVDASIIPMIPGTHLLETVYAIAEKAADIIKART